MQKFIPFAKLSKKTQQEINKSHRKSWGNIDPVSGRLRAAHGLCRADNGRYRHGFSLQSEQSDRKPAFARGNRTGDSTRRGAWLHRRVRRMLFRLCGKSGRIFDAWGAGSVSACDSAQGVYQAVCDGRGAAGVRHLKQSGDHRKAGTQRTAMECFFARAGGWSRGTRRGRLCKRKPHDAARGAGISFASAGEAGLPHLCFAGKLYFFSRRDNPRRKAACGWIFGAGLQQLRGSWQGLLSCRGTAA